MNPPKGLKMRAQIKWVLALVSLPIILLSFSCTDSLSTEEKRGLRAAPDFTLRDLKGGEVTLSQFKGEKNVLLVFGATWCPPCRHEIPELKEIYQKYADGELKLLYIDIQESAKKVGSLVKQYSIPYTVLLDTDAEAARAYQVRGIPHMVIVDKEGLIYYEGHRPYDGLMPLLIKLTER